MEPELPRTHGHRYEPQQLSDNPAGMHPGVGSENEGYQEKQSMLKKVKAKAKKIKNTITKHGHGHVHEEFEEEDDDEDEEMVKDPEIQGAPIYESAAVRSAAPAPGAGLGAGENLEKPSLMAEDRYDPPAKLFRQWEKEGGGEGGEEKQTDNLGGFGAESINPLPEHKQIPLTRTEQDYGLGMNRTGVPTDMEKMHGGIGTHTGLEEDPHGPYVRDVSSNVQAETIDPSGKGSEEAVGITPIIQSFHKMGVSDTTDQKPKSAQGGKLYTGSHDQFAPEPPRHEIPVSVPETNDAINPVTMPRDALNPSNQSSTFAPEPIGHDNPDLVAKSYEDIKPETVPGDTLNPSNQSSTFTPEPIGHDNPDLVAKSYEDIKPETVPGDTLNPSNQSSTFAPEPIGHDNPDLVAKSYEDIKPETVPGDTLNPSNQSSTFAPEPIGHDNPDLVAKSYEDIKPETVPGDTLNPSNQSSTFAPEPIGHDNPGLVAKSYEDIKPETAPGDTLNLSNQSSTFAPEPIGHDNPDLVAKSYEDIKPETVPGDTLSSTFAPEPIGHDNPDLVAKSYEDIKPETVPGDTLNPSNQSSTYTEKIKSASAAASSAIANTTQSAKNVMASKLEQGHDSTTQSGCPTGTSSDCAHKSAATLMETVAPVAGAGSAVTSKVTETGDETPHERNESVGEDTGVLVTQNNFAEKLKPTSPTEDDKALTQMINTETLSKPEKTEELPVGGERGDSGMVSDVMNKRGTDETGEQKIPIEKVTELAEAGEEKKMEKLGGGGGVVNRIKGVVGSWFSGEGGEAQISPGTTLAGEEKGGMRKDAGVAEERRLPESE